MVDFFLLLMLAGAGDELQGIKKGIMEMADAIVITKADGENIKKATEAQAEYQHALHLFPMASSGWRPNVLTCSALTNNGIKEVWKAILNYKETTTSSGYFDQHRRQQRVTAFRDMFDQLVKNDLTRFPTVVKETDTLEKSVAEYKILAYEAAQQLLALYHQSLKKS
jgi:LAO/AO transport system kinase